MGRWWGSVNSGGDVDGNGGGRPSLADCGEELFNGKVRCRYRGCRRWCASWLGLAVHLRKGHGVSAGEVSWGDLRREG